jgi:hypothetical protein
MKDACFRDAVLGVMSLGDDITTVAEPSYDERELAVRTFFVKQALMVQATLETKHGVPNKRSLLHMVRSADSSTIDAVERLRMERVAKRANAARHKRWRCCPRHPGSASAVFFVATWAWHRFPRQWNMVTTLLLIRPLAVKTGPVLCCVLWTAWSWTSTRIRTLASLRTMIPTWT